MQGTMRMMMVVLMVAAFVMTGNAAAATPIDSAKAFVRELYRWYVPLAHGTDSGPAWRAITTRRKSSLDATLLEALRKDLDAQAHSNEVVGLDFDPFLASQDPCSEYRVTSARAAGTDVLVTVKGTCEGADAVVLVVAPAAKGGWNVKNVRYADGSDLLSLLAQLAHDR